MAVRPFQNEDGLLVIASDTLVEEFISGGAIVQGDWVKYDISQTGADRLRYIVQGTASGLTFGVALEAASAAGQVVRVAVEGYVEGAKTDGTVASGDSLVSDAAGACLPYVAADTLPIIGVALETDSGTTCDVKVFRNH